MLYKSIDQPDILSFNQKGFFLNDGVFESNYVLDDIVGITKIKRKKLFFTSLAVTNAFGSLPHWSIFGLLETASAREGNYQHSKGFL